MTAEDMVLTPVAEINVLVTNPESPFGGVQIVGIAEAPINVIIHEGVQGPAGPPGPSGPSGGDGTSDLIEVQNQGVTRLVAGQGYIDVVFDSIQADENWIFVECEVVNTVDLAPLNIWVGLVTSKTPTGFRRQLNGMPDSNNYYLYWATSGITTTLPPPAGDTTPPTVPDGLTATFISGVPDVTPPTAPSGLSATAIIGTSTG